MGFYVVEAVEDFPFEKAEEHELDEQFDIGTVIDFEVSRTEEIIEACIIRFMFEKATGNVFGVLETFYERYEPQYMVSGNVLNHLGIKESDFDHEGAKKLDFSKIKAIIDKPSSVIIAHNSKFDKYYLHKLYKENETPPPKMIWGCSIMDIDWKSLGYSGSLKLEELCRKFGTVKYNFDRKDPLSPWHNI